MPKYQVGDILAIDQTPHLAYHALVAEVTPNEFYRLLLIELGEIREEDIFYVDNLIYVTKVG